ncbi:MAG: MarR family transcriptional regulator [Streptosporangiales bacterium]|nr:MarR family transcriptional regulator [Streptosporangiales bacterium]
MTRWLDDDQQLAWRAYLRGNARLGERLDRDLHDRHGLSVADYEILVILSESEDGRLRMTVLADSVLFSKSRISHAVARLERAGLVRRESCPEDKRGIFAVLTEEGYRRLAEAARTHVAGVRDYFVDVISPGELQTIGRAFAEVDRRIREQTGEPNAETGPDDDI